VTALARGPKRGPPLARPWIALSVRIAGGSSVSLAFLHETHIAPVGRASMLAKGTQGSANSPPKISVQDLDAPLDRPGCPRDGPSAADPDHVSVSPNHARYARFCCPY